MPPVHFGVFGKQILQNSQNCTTRNNQLEKAGSNEAGTTTSLTTPDFFLQECVEHRKTIVLVYQIPDEEVKTSNGLSQKAFHNKQINNPTTQW